MNIYRIYSEFKKDGSIVFRNRLLERLKGKPSFTEEDLNDIFAYKNMQYHSNPGAEKNTGAVFASNDLGEKLRLLKRLNGVGVVTASTILMFQNPYKYAELNHKTWAQLKRNFGFTGSDKDHRSDYGVHEYRNYLELLGELATEYGISVADVEFVLSRLE